MNKETTLASIIDELTKLHKQEDENIMFIVNSDTSGGVFVGYLPMSSNELFSWNRLDEIEQAFEEYKERSLVR